jgi:RimJ/RimL family protein N-acetyltransferase
VAAEPRAAAPQAAAVRLEPLVEAHVPAVERMVDDPDTLRFTRLPEPVPEGWVASWIERYVAGRRDGVRAGFAALDDDGALLGVALAPNIDREGAEAELGYIVAREARRRGVATDMLRQLTDWAFAEGILRAYLLIDAGNPASLRVAERAGYVREGVLRNTYLKPGRRGDTVIWSRLPSDPAP